MDNSWTALSQYELSDELDSIERAIARIRTVYLGTDVSGRIQAQLSPELLALAEHQHQIVSELRRRRRTATPAA